jgi:hypothetical protein
VAVPISDNMMTIESAICELMFGVEGEILAATSASG